MTEALAQFLVSFVRKHGDSVDNDQINSLASSGAISGSSTTTVVSTIDSATFRKLLEDPQNREAIAAAVEASNRAHPGRLPVGSVTIDKAGGVVQHKV